MANHANFLDITLLGKEYRVACPPDEKDALLRAVGYLDGKMSELTSDKTRGQAATERVAVTVALNIAHEFLQLQDRAAANSPEDAGGLDIGAAKRKIASMEARLDSILEAPDRLI